MAISFAGLVNLVSAEMIRRGALENVRLIKVKGDIIVWKKGLRAGAE